MRRTKILVIDAGDSVVGAVRDALVDADVDVVADSRMVSPFDSVRAEAPGVVVADARTLGEDPSSWIADVTRTRPALVVIVLAGAGNGSPAPIPEAFDVLGRPPSAAALRRACGRALEHHRLLHRLHELGGIRPESGPRDEDSSAADRRFRDAKRTVVDAFEQAYLEDLLRRHRGNVTAAASHSGMLRSALQRLLRKHDLRSSEFRLAGPSDTGERPPS